MQWAALCAKPYRLFQTRSEQWQLPCYHQGGHCTLAACCHVTCFSTLLGWVLPESLVGQPLTASCAAVLLQAQRPAQLPLLRPDRLRSSQRAAALAVQLAEAARCPPIPLGAPRRASWTLEPCAGGEAQWYSDALDFADAVGAETLAAGPAPVLDGDRAGSDAAQGLELGLGYGVQLAEGPPVGASNAVPMPAAARERWRSQSVEAGANSRASATDRARRAEGLAPRAVAYVALPWLALAAGQLGAVWRFAALWHVWMFCSLPGIPTLGVIAGNLQ